MRRLALLTILLLGGSACDDDGGKGGPRDADAGGADADARGADVPAGTDGGLDSPDDFAPVDGPDGPGAPIFSDAEPSADLPPGGLDVAPREWMLMNNFEGAADLPSFWAVFTGGRMTGDTGDPPTAEIAPPRAASRTAMRLMGPAVADGAIVNVHHLFDWTELFIGVRFWARATGGDQPTEILVALTDLRSATELYYAGLRASRPWRVKRLRLTGEWQQFSVRFDELAPEGTGTPVPLHGTGSTNGGGELHFIVPENRAYDVWIDDIELGCKTGRCGPGFI